ncbi:uncharacterized protein B0I36DRAFT_364410 [Microdochium trichocladiopsis]|uniref:Uncharacterized protein n=1 Tax=Microdochium trichocladiopsis TaxID=1682393 RepID=A0A9P8Y0Y4_9PEZI|nr:uncharacterized protein B0I36DRAFT_364410 [Microdochium trichocladiopsis]KAH7027165.1 hypothetical protein B0I36DRAFT_364410 [Microdochium trichocladiopsis]
MDTRRVISVAEKVRSPLSGEDRSWMLPPEILVTIVASVSHMRTGYFEEDWPQAVNRRVLERASENCASQVLGARIIHGVIGNSFHLIQHPRYDMCDADYANVHRKTIEDVRDNMMRARVETDMTEGQKENVWRLGSRTLRMENDHILQRHIHQLSRLLPEKRLNLVLLSEEGGKVGWMPMLGIKYNTGITGQNKSEWWLEAWQHGL